MQDTHRDTNWSANECASGAGRRKLEIGAGRFIGQLDVTAHKFYDGVRPLW